MACRTPGARSLEEFWDVIREGRDCIERFRAENSEDVFSGDLRAQANYVAARGVLDDVETFDALRFEMTAREAALTDPQHRVFLEVAQHALEHANCVPHRFKGLIGVYAGCSFNTYLLRHVLQDRAMAEAFSSHYQLGMYSELLGALNDTLATRVAYKLDLKGPAASVQTACSTGLYAVAQAVQALQLYQCDAALAGGVSVTFPQRRGYFYQEGGMGSADGVCRPFDAKASGVVFGSGAGAVLLKRAEDALANGDEIYAFILGCGVNNDGAQKAAFTAPSAAGQQGAIAAALAEANVLGRDVEFVECHGTATPLGDPIEFEGLRRAYGEGSPCALGSVKANVGHLDAAAGVVGLIKAALVLKHASIPAMTHFSAPNPHLRMEGTRFFAPRALTPWAASSHPRYAGVSSFGVGGTNVHVILQEGVTNGAADTESNRTYIMPISAMDGVGVARQAESLCRFMHSSNGAAEPVAAIAETLKAGRAALPERAWVVGRTRSDFVTALHDVSSMRAQANAQVVFLFPGQGAQAPGMARALYHRFACFRSDIDAALALHAQSSDADLAGFLLSKDAGDDASSTVLAQPALYTFGYALARLWMRLGLAPAAMIGHSVGEFAAAAIAGVFTFEDGMRLITQRAMLMEQAPHGAMLAVRASADSLALLLNDDLTIAAYNAPESVVVAGAVGAIEQFETRLKEGAIPHKRLPVQRAFHSPMMASVAEAMSALAAQVSLRPPSIPIISTLTGAIEGAMFTDPDYWGRHVRAPVRLHDAARNVPKSILLEIGVGATLGPLVRRGAQKGCVQAFVSTMSDIDDGETAFLLACGKVWACGASVDLVRLDEGPTRKAVLPGYVYARDRHWIEAPKPEERTKDDASIAEMPTPLDVPRASNAHDDVKNKLRAILSELSGQEVTAGEDHIGFLELGFDSLTLGQVATRIQNVFDVKVNFRQLMSATPSIEILAEHLARVMPRALSPTLPSTAAPTSDVAALGATAASGTDLTQVFTAQIAAMKALIDQQNAILSGRGADLAAEKPSTAIPSADPASNRFRVYSPAAARQKRDMSEAQVAHVRALEAAWNSKTQKSKALAARHRRAMADPRSVSGFRAEWKNLIYPLVVERAQGALLWDIDGNEYIDLVNGYGQTMFGHSPDFVQRAIAQQSAAGYPIGPQSPMSGEVAERIARAVGMDRVTFCSTGSEAVMAAMRVARCVTGRDTIVIFANDYHGQFDEVLVKQKTGAPGALPIAPGIPVAAVSNMMVLPYGEQASLDWINANIAGLAAVIVEPVQSRKPSLQPFAFLKTLREITRAGGAALVFDEVVTGFRVHMGGMQAVLGVKADLATYGKVLGGGLPIGVLAGDARFMDALDGGDWRFEDDSIPEVAPTFFAGTFVRHPLALAACAATLQHLEREGAELQSGLDSATEDLVRRLNAVCEDRGVTLRAERYSSWFMLEPAKHDPLGGLLFHHMRLNGVHVQEGFPCFLTTAHTSVECERIVKAFTMALDALMGVGILLPDGAATSRDPSLPPCPSERVALNESQVEVLTAALMSPQASLAFNEVVRLSFKGRLKESALRKAIDALVARHDSLRARLDLNALCLVIDANRRVALTLETLESAADEALDACAEREASTPFDLGNGPLIRFRLCVVSETAATLFIAAHHVICDGWSMSAMCNDLARLYNYHCGESAEALEPAPRLSSLRVESAPRDLDYWKGVLSVLPDRLDLPHDRKRASARAFNGATATTLLTKELLDGVRRAGARNGATLFATLLSSVHLLLARLSGQSDIVVGVPVAGQSLVDAPAPIGHFVQFLPVRLAVAAEASVGQHVRSVQSAMASALEHAGVTFGAIVSALGERRDAQRPPLTDVQFNLERFGEDLDFVNLETQARPCAKRAVVFDLFFNMIESKSGLRIDVDFDADLYDQSTIEMWLEALRCIIEGIAQPEAHEAPVLRLPVLSATQREWLLSRNIAYAPIDDAQTIATVFAEVAREYAARPALLYRNQTMSYAELDEKSTHMAAALSALGIGSGDRVAILSDRGPNAIVALLAVLKCGAVFVPLDVRAPRDRLFGILEDCEAKLVLACAEREADIAGAVSILSFEDALQRKLTITAGASRANIKASSPASIMFTSGSTGRAKGAVIPHRAILRLVKQQTYIAFGPDEVFLHMAPLSFDASTLEVFGALLHGATLAIAEGADTTLSEIENTIKRHKVTTAWFTAALFHAIVDERPSVISTLRQILTGGDVVSAQHIARAMKIAPRARFVNGYGPTENTTFTACHVFGSDLDVQEASPIGMPIGGSRVYVVDERDELTIPGVKGELLVAGEGLALAYVNRESLTAQRFCAAPSLSESRVYRTGDIVSWRKDGALMFHGRRDRQLKINGFRVEPGEIEAVLRGQPGVSDAVAEVQVDSSGSRWIEAWIVWGAGAADDFQEQHLLSVCAERLPRYMVPRRIHVAAALPRTANGKLNRSALHVRMNDAPAAMAPSSQIASAVEQQIHDIWADVLKRPQISPTEKIFSLGADSLHLLRICARFAAAGIALELRHMMANPSIADLAAQVSGARPTARDPLDLAGFRKGARRPT
jgi:amino acid adenylation domain-containing protein